MRFLAVFAPILLVACGSPAPENASTAADGGANALTPTPVPGEYPQLNHAWVRLPAVAGRPAAAYFTLTGGAGDDALIGVSSPAAQRSELHESMEHGGVMSMQAIPTVPLGAGAQMDFAPGGKHVMLFDVDAGLQPGGKVILVADFETGPDVMVEALLVAPGGEPPH